MTLSVIHHPKLPPRPEEKALLDEIAALPCVARAVALPDLHLKDDLEAPSSAAFGVRGHIIPHLSSCALNCGMGLVRTGLEADALSPDRIDAFYDAFRRSREEARGVFDLEPAELRRVVVEGAPAIARRYELEPETLDGMESRGAVLDDAVSPAEAWQTLDPDMLDDPDWHGLRDLGLGFGGNHFLELHVLDDELDARECARLGLARGQVYVMYHGGGGVLPGFVGGYYGNRRKGYVNDWRLTASKLRFHFARPSDWLRLRERWRYYFSAARFPAIPVDGPEGRRNRVALEVAMNYGYAYRVAMAARARWALERAFGRDLARPDVKIVWDASHNTIAEETIAGEKLWVHRHNAARVRPGEFACLPGHHTTPSLVGVGLGRAAETLDSMSHGAGETIEMLRELGEGGASPPLATRRYEAEAREPRVVDHAGGAGLDAVARLLEEHGIWRPVARLRPVGVLKKYHY